MDYSLDVPTLGLVLCLVYLTNGVLSLLMIGAGRSFPGASLWVAAQGTMAAGAVIMMFRPWLPLWVPVIWGNGCYIAVAFLFSHAIWSFRFGKTFPLGFYGLFPLALLSLAAIVDQPFEIRVMVYTLWTGVGALVSAVLLLWRVESQYRVATALASLPFLVTAAASLVRFFWNWSGPDTDYVHQSGANALFLLGSVLISTITLFGYFLMTGVRAEQIVSRKDEEIEARNRKLVVSGRAKDLFFSIIAHDLRGPIGGSARYVRKHLLGKMSGLESKYHEVETLASALEKTNEFLEKLLWWARAQLQDWVPDQVPLDLGKVFEQAQALVRSAAEMKEIPVHWPSTPHQRPVADPESVQLILGNLLSNAVKFSLPGRPIHVWVESESLLCKIIVQDEGVGMDASTLDRLFRIEDKLTTHGTSGERGSGLGLILAQSLAERNNGGITMESEPGRGTKATLWLSMQNP